MSLRLRRSQGCTSRWCARKSSVHLQISITRCPPSYLLLEHPVVSATVEYFAGPVVLEWHQLVEICTTVDHGFLVNGNALAVLAAFEYLSSAASVSVRRFLRCAVSKTGAAGAAGAGSGLTGAGAASRQAQPVLVVLLFVAAMPLRLLRQFLRCCCRNHPNSA